jgi:hypothetical protein
MNKLNGFKLSNLLSNSQTLSKKASIMNLVIMIQMCNEQPRIEMNTKVTNAQLDNIGK